MLCGLFSLLSSLSLSRCLSLSMQASQWCRSGARCALQLLQFNLAGQLGERLMQGRNPCQFFHGSSCCGLWDKSCIVHRLVDAPFFFLRCQLDIPHVLPPPLAVPFFSCRWFSLRGRCLAPLGSGGRLHPVPEQHMGSQYGDRCGERWLSAARTGKFASLEWRNSQRRWAFVFFILALGRIPQL